MSHVVTWSTGNDTEGALHVGVQTGTDVITVNPREEHISSKSNRNVLLGTERCNINRCVKMS